MWDAGYSPMLEIDFDPIRGKQKGVDKEDIDRILQQFRNANRTRRQWIQVMQTPGGHLVQFRRNYTSRSSIVDFYLMKPDAIFDLDVEPEGSISDVRVPLRDVADIRIVAGNYR